MNRKILSILPKKLSPFTKILLFFNHSTSKNPAFVFIVIFPKYFALLALVSNFTLDYDAKFKANYYISNHIRRFTLFHYANNFTPLVYYLVSLALFLFQSFFAFILIYFYYNIKKNNKNVTIGYISKIFFYIQAVFSQHFLEFYSYGLLFMFRNLYTLPTEQLFAKYSNFVILTCEDNYNKITIYIFGILNIINYLSLNIFLIFSGFIINSPFQTTKASITFLHNTYNIFLCITANIYAFHYYGFILPEKNRIIFKSLTFGFFFVLCLGDALQNLNNFEKATFAYMILKFLNYYCIISMLAEIIIGILKVPLSLREVIMTTCLKFFMSFLTLILFRYYKARSLISLTSSILFEYYESSHLDKFIEVYHFLIDLLIKDKQSYFTSLIDITNILEKHKNKCDNKNCKCNLIKLFPHEVLINNEEYTNWIYSALGFYLELTFINIPSFCNIDVSILLAEYYFLIKNNPLLAISIIQSTITINLNKCSLLTTLKMLAIHFHYLEEYSKMNKRKESFVHFKQIYDSINERYDLTKIILNYCTIFDNLVDNKINFENSIKIITDPDTKELLSVSSIFLNRKTLQKVMKLLFLVTKKNKEIFSILLKNSDKTHTADFYYLVYLYFSIFDNKIPNKIKNAFSKVDIGETFLHFSDEKIGMQLEKYLDKYLMVNSCFNEVILKFSKGIKIKYFSSNLCISLGFSSFSIVGEDFNSLFPKTLKDLHIKAMYNFIFGQQQILFKGSTHIFDSNNNLRPCKIIASTLPCLSKSLMAICEISLKKDNKMIALFDGDFNACSVSKEFEAKFYINLNLLKQCDTELYEILDFQPKEVKKFFTKQLDTISKIKKQLDLNCIEQYTKNLFYSKINDENDKSDKKYILTRNSFESTKPSNKLTKSQAYLHMNSSNNKNVMYFSKQKNVIVSNIIKTFNKLSDSSIKEDSLKKLFEGIYAFQKCMTYTQNQKENNNHLSILKETKVRTSVFSCKNKTPEREEIHVNSKIHFKIQAKKIYNTPIYIVELKESRTKNKQNLPKIIIAEPKICKKQQKSNRLQSVPSLVGNLGINSKTGFKKISMKKAEKVVKRELIILVIILLLMICFTSTNTIISKNSIKKVNVIFTFLYEIYYQRDKLIYMQSTLLTQAFEVGGLSKMNVTNEESFNYLLTTTQSLEESVISMYKSMLYYNEQLNLKNLSLVQNQTFFKIVGNWETYSYNSDYFSEIFYTVYLANIEIREKDVTNMKKDIDILFSKNFLTNLKQTINSSFIQVFFYVNTNISLSLGNIISSLLNEVGEKLKDFLKTQKFMQFLILFLLLGLIVSFFMVSLIIFLKFNKRIYKLIVSMFFDDNLHSKSNLINKNEDFYMKQLIKNYIQLLRNFNEENLNIVQDLRKEGFNSQYFISSSKRISTVYDNNPNQTTDNNIYSPNNSSMLSYGNSFINNSLLNSNQQSNNVTNTSNSFLESQSNLLKQKNNSSFLNVISNNHKNIKQIEKKDKSLENFAITSKKLVSLVTKVPIQTEIWMFYLLFILLSVIIAIVIFMALNFNDFHKFIFFSIKIFESYTNYYYSISLSFNSIRKTIINKKKPSQNLLTFIGYIFSYKKEKESFKTKKNVKNFSEMNKLFNYASYASNDTNNDLDFLCGSNELCIKMIQSPNGYCSLGIILGSDLVVQKFQEIVSGFSVLLDENENYSQDDLKDFLKAKEFEKVQENVDLIFSQIQNTVYKTFIQDYLSHVHFLKYKRKIIDLTFWLVELLSILTIVGFIFQSLKYKIYLIEFGSTKFHSAFFKET